MTIGNDGKTIIGTKAGAVTLRATHKVTGRSCIFSVEIKPHLEKEADYLLPDDIVDKLYTLRSMISQIENSSISANSKNRYIEELELQEDIVRADYILENDNYSSTYAQMVIPDFLNQLDQDFESTNTDDLYKVVANRLLILFGIECEDTEINRNGFFLDVDCNYREWGVESKTACAWYLNSISQGDFWTKLRTVDAQITGSQSISRITQYRNQHETVKNFVARSLGGKTEVKIPKGSLSGNDGYADIMVAKSNGGGTNIWEVKPNKTKYYSSLTRDGIGTKQLRKYIDAAQAAESNKISKNGEYFYKEFTAGYPLIPFYLQDSDESWFEVSPPPYSPHISPDQGLILYRKLENNEKKDPDRSQYNYADSQIELMRSTAYGDPIVFAKADLVDLAIVFTEFVVAGTVMVLLVCAPIQSAPAITAVATNTATSAIKTQIEMEVTKKVTKILIPSSAAEQVFREVAEEIIRQKAA